MYKIICSQPFYSIFRASNYLKNSIPCIKLPQLVRFTSNIASNYYAVLELEPRASEDKVKNAYYELSKQYHPDKNIGNDMATQKILEINEAFEVLGNKVEKEKYDEKFFPGWNKPKRKANFIYEHTEYYEEPLVNRVYRKKTSGLELKYQQYKKHTKGEKKRKGRHAAQKYYFNKHMSSNCYAFRF